jgi:hypothetical protein
VMGVGGKLKRKNQTEFSILNNCSLFQHKEGIVFFSASLRKLNEWLQSWMTGSESFLMQVNYNAIITSNTT